jgi:hypothetical protein
VAGKYGPCLKHRDRIIPICCFVPTAFAITCITSIKDSKRSGIFKGYIFAGLANHNKALSNCRKSTNSVERIFKLMINLLKPLTTFPKTRRPPCAKKGTTHAIPFGNCVTPSSCHPISHAYADSTPSAVANCRKDSQNITPPSRDHRTQPPTNQ